MRILITGGEGLFGRALVRVCTAGGHDVTALRHAQLDITDGAVVSRAIDRVGADYVINCAALTDTAQCEREPDEAMRVNAYAAARAAQVCAQTDNMGFVSISTNEVFDGTSTAPYAEDYTPGPINAYGRSKLEGERRIAEMQRGALVRTAWLYGDGERSFVARVLAAARVGRPLRFVTDEVASPTSADDLADAIAALVESHHVHGIYHLTNEGAASRYDWAREIVRLAGLDPSIVQPVTTAELRASGYDGPEKPPYSVLANNRARALGIVMRPWQEALAAHFDQHPELRSAASSVSSAHG